MSWSLDFVLSLVLPRGGFGKIIQAIMKLDPFDAM